MYHIWCIFGILLVQYLTETKPIGSSHAGYSLFFLLSILKDNYLPSFLTEPLLLSGKSVKKDGKLKVAKSRKCCFFRQYLGGKFFFVNFNIKLD